MEVAWASVRECCLRCWSSGFSFRPSVLGLVERRSGASNDPRPSAVVRCGVLRPPGYLVRVEAGALDLERFENLVQRGRGLLASPCHRHGPRAAVNSIADRASRVDERANSRH